MTRDAASPPSGDCPTDFPAPASPRRRPGSPMPRLPQLLSLALLLAACNIGVIPRDLPPPAAEPPATLALSAAATSERRTACNLATARSTSRTAVA